MKLLVVGPDIRDIGRVKNFTGMQAFYIARELRKRGVDLHFIDHKPKGDPLQYFRGVDGAGCEHVLALGLRYFTHQPAGCAAILKTKIPGTVTQLHDGVVHESLAEHLVGVDCTFTFRDDSTRARDWKRYSASNHYIGWAADPEFLYPQQSDELRILIDHVYYKQGQPDMTAAITRDAVMFARTSLWRDRYRTLKLRRLVNGGAEDVDMNATVRQFDRKHVPFVEIAAEYRRAHLFMVTHRESVGLTCLETAYCGALPVVPAGMIYRDRLDTFRHVEYEGDRVPWMKVLDAIDIQASADIACQHTWDKVVDRMLTWFGGYK